MPGLFPSQRELEYSAWQRSQTDAMQQDQRSFLMARQAQQQAAAELAARERMQSEQIAAQHASQRFAADRASSDAYNARNDAYSMATDPRLAAIEQKRLNEALGREQALIGTQSGARINEHFEGMLDDRAKQQGIDINRARLDAVSTMQRGNIDARLMALQGQNARSLAGVNNEFALQRDAAQSGHSINEDAWSRMQNRKAALMEMEMQEQQAGVTLAKPDQDKRDALWEEYRRLEDEVDSRNLSPRQALPRMDEITRKLGQTRATVKQVPLSEQFRNESVREPDGRTFTYNKKTGSWDSHMPPSGSKPENSDPRAIELKLSSQASKEALEEYKALVDNTNSPGAIDYGSILNKRRKMYGLPPVDEETPAGQGRPAVDPQELFRHVQGVNQAAAQSGVPVQKYLQQLSQRNPEAAEAYVAGVRMIQQAQGGPTDPRSGAVMGPADRGNQVPGQRMVPGQPGPTVDPRLLQMQGQPAQTPSDTGNQSSGTPQRQDSPTAARMDALSQRSLGNDDQQTAGALQAFKTITQKYGGLPPAGSEEEQIVMQAAAYLRKRGIDPTGGVRRAPKQPERTYGRPSLSSRNLAE